MPFNGQRQTEKNAPPLCKCKKWPLFFCCQQGTACFKLLNFRTCLIMCLENQGVMPALHSDGEGGTAADRLPHVPFLGFPGGASVGPRLGDWPPGSLCFRLGRWPRECDGARAGQSPPPPRGLWGSHQYPWTEALSLRLDLEAGEALRTTPHSPVLDGGGCKETLDLGRGEGGVDPDLRKHPFPKRVKATAWKSARARRHALTNTHALTHSSATHMALMTSPGRGRVFRVGVHLQASWAGPHPVGHALGSLRLQLDAHGGNPGPGRRRHPNQWHNPQNGFAQRPLAAESHYTSIHSIFEIRNSSVKF